jgi:glycosyltransferase involved in cell wall biosynthesis
MPRITVVVPLFNERGNIDGCVDRIRSQSLNDWELVLVDDGSDDGTAERIDALAAEDDRIIARHQDRGGAAAARNAGIEAATGDYLMFVDCDDWLEPGALATSVSKMDEHDVDLLIGGYNTRIFNDDHTEELSCTPIATDEEWLFSMQDFDVWGAKLLELSAMLFFCVWDKVFRTSILKKNRVRFEEGLLAQEDVTFCYDYYFFCDSCMVTNEMLYNYTREEHKDDVADLDYIDQWSFMVSPLSAFLRLNEKLGLSEEFVHTIYGWTFLHMYVLSSKVYLPGTGLSDQEQNEHIRALTDSFPFVYFCGHMAYDPFWARMAELRAAGDIDEILVEWKQRVLGGWTVETSDTWANKSSEELSQ